jgi:hypothetical protein
MKNLVLALLFLSAAGCAAWPPEQLPSPQEVLTQWQEPPAGGRAVRMRGDLALKLPGQQINAEHTLVINEQGQFQLDMFGPFEKRVFSLSCDGRQLLAVFFDDNQAYFGPATPANLARLLGMDLNPVHIFMILSNQPPFWLSAEELRDQGQIIASSNQGLLLLLLKRPQTPWQSITFDLATWTARAATLQEDDGRLFEISYRRLDEESGLPLSLNLSASDGRAVDIYNDQAQWLANKPVFTLPPLPAAMRLSPFPEAE